MSSLFHCSGTRFTPPLPAVQQDEVPCERPCCSHPASTSSAVHRRRFRWCWDVHGPSTSAGDTHWSASGVEPGMVGVPERVPTDSDQPEPFRSRTDVVLLYWARVIAPVRNRAWKHPVTHSLSALAFPGSSHTSFSDDANWYKIRRALHDDDCLAYLEPMRWPNGVRCPVCGCDRISKITPKNERTHIYKCLEATCKQQFFVTSGTIFNDSHLPLTKWFMVLALIVDAKKSICLYKSHWTFQDRTL